MRKNDILGRFVRFNYCISIKQVYVTPSVTLHNQHSPIEMAVMLFYVTVNGELEHQARNKVIPTRHAHHVTVLFWGIP